MSSILDTKLVSSIETYQQRLVEITQTLVRQDSCNPPGNASSVAAVAIEVLRKAIPFAEISTYETAPGITNVVAVIKGLANGPSRRLLFSGHLDTYPIGQVDKWSVEPFGGYMDAETGRLFGRGSVDMKGGIAASITAACALAEHRDQWSGEIVIALAGDEETMGTLGSAYLLDHVPAVRDADAVICGDAGSPQVLRIGEKGLVWIDITATGVAAHGAHVHRGENAIERLLGAITALKGLESLSVSSPSEVLAVIDAAKDISEPLGGQGEENILKRITVNIGKISGGTSANLVPDKAEASADIRLPIGISTAEVSAFIRDKLESLKGIKYRITRQYEPSWTSPTEKIVQDACSAAEVVMRTKSVVNVRVGASDTRLFRVKDIPSVVVGLTPYNMGGPDECVDVNELVQVSKIHALAAWWFLKT
ncbi:hypothetical protein NM208_g10659 [Fusarium decemcellulare]|uniref:Uncharacterized protein n=1 Tax=Fusarium decemcellulare TaxID=57161 RepID=A0ACC1RX29_9HYPO|nr:hypothetical protein NM208_g10659 [Fusarium decemcellulare]